MNDSPVAISDQVLVHRILTPLTLYANGKFRWLESDGQRWLSLERDLIGFTAEGAEISMSIAVESRDGLFCCGRGALETKQFVFEPLSDESKQLWCRKLDEFVVSLGRPKRLFIFVNPYGGKKSASKIFHDDVKPLLVHAQIGFTVQETKHQLHAKEIVSSLDLSNYDGVLCISGDGVLVEVVNGLLEREDWEAAIKTPIGIIPAGTGNGMIKSLLDSVGDSCTAFNAALAIIRGHKCSLDVSTISQGKTRFFSVLMLAWGLVADIDIESEKFRWMGSARFDFYALQRVLYLRKYEGSVYFVPAPGFETLGELSSQESRSIDELHIWNPNHDNHGKRQLCGYGGPNHRFENLEWRSISGPFVSIWLQNVPWGSENTKAAPDAKLSDGCLDLIIIRHCPKLALLGLLMQLDRGTHVKSPYVMYIKVKAFALKPGPRMGEERKGGIVDVDGEVVAKGEGVWKSQQKCAMAYGPLQVTIDPGLATLFAPMPPP